jgi:NADH dehydrogenase
MTWRHGRQPAPDAPKVIVVGAGFAGLNAVSHLVKGNPGAQVLLIDRNIYSTFQPLLYQVATAGLNPGDVAYPIRAFTRSRGARFRLGELAAIDPQARQVTLADGGRYDYDYLVLATGVTAAYYGVAGAAGSTLGLYTRRDAVTLRDHIMARLERLATGPARDVTFTVVGGGATGVELAGTLAELRFALETAFPEIEPRRVTIRLVEQFGVLLAPFEAGLQRYAYQQLRDRGVDVRLNATIREVTPNRVRLADGEDLPSDLTVWAAGVAASGAVAGWGLPQGKGGRISVGPDLRVTGQDRIFAGGDIAVEGEHPLPQLAQPAIQAGRHIAAQIRNLAAGRPTAPLSYHDKGIMATIGRRSAVVQLPHGVRFRGTLAWLAWLALHLVTLLGGRNRLSALVNLSWRYLTWGHGAGIIVGDDPPAVAPSTPPQLPTEAAEGTEVTGAQTAGAGAGGHGAGGAGSGGHGTGGDGAATGPGAGPGAAARVGEGGTPDGVGVPGGGATARAD